MDANTTAKTRTLVRVATPTFDACLELEDDVCVLAAPLLYLVRGQDAGGAARGVRAPSVEGDDHARDVRVPRKWRTKVIDPPISMAYKNDHKHGRPARADEPTTKSVSVRLTQEEFAALASHVERDGKPGSVLIREAMEEKGLFKPVRKRGG